MGRRSTNRRGLHNRRNKIVFISWVPNETPTFVSPSYPWYNLASTCLPFVKWSMLYATSRQTLKNAINPHTSIHADDKSDIEWKNVLKEASSGKAQ